MLVSPRSLAIFQSRFTAALPDYHEHPRVFAQLKRGVNHALQPLFFADVA